MLKNVEQRLRQQIKDLEAERDALLERAERTLTRERATHETSGDINPDESRLLLWAKSSSPDGRGNCRPSTRRSEFAPGAPGAAARLGRRPANARTSPA